MQVALCFVCICISLLLLWGFWRTKAIQSNKIYTHNTTLQLQLQLALHSARSAVVEYSLEKCDFLFKIVFSFFLHIFFCWHLDLKQTICSRNSFQQKSQHMNLLLKQLKLELIWNCLLLANAKPLKNLKQKYIMNYLSTLTTRN